jgi:hypothetical protein
LFTKLTLFVVDEFADKVLNLVGGSAGDLFGLVEEEGGGV